MMQLLTPSKAVGENGTVYDLHNAGRTISVDFTYTLQDIFLLSDINEVIYLKHDGKYLL